MKKILGIDIGGSGIKGTIVDTATGKLLFERYRILTPKPPTPIEIAYKIKEIADYFDYQGIIGCGFPAVIQKGIIKTASNIDTSNINVNANELFSKIVGLKVKVINDADAAGIAEISFGSGRNVHGVVLVLTIGTGIGSALFINGKIVPNTEFGHIFMHNKRIAEKYTSDKTRKKRKLEWPEWGQRFNEYLMYLEKIFNPDLIIIGGGASKKYDLYKDQININSKIIPAQLLNNAGIIGAAVNASFQ